MPSAAAPEPLGAGDRRAFISHASADRTLAESLAAYLEERGIACWMAPRDVAPGALYAEAIIRAISDSRALVLILSEHSVASAHVGKELERASSKRRPIIAVRVDAAPLPPAFEYFLSESQWIEVPALGREAAFAKLAEALHGSELASRPLPAATASATGRPGIGRALALIAVLVVVAASAFVFWRARQPVAPAASADLHSIAVLPFADMSQAHDQEYFADGMAEEILDLLAKIPSLKVIARSSSFQFKGKSEDLRLVGERLGVATLLEGSVRKAGEHLRITAQLIRAADGSHLWSETYDREVSDVFRTQDEIAEAVVRALRLSLLGALPARSAPTTNAQAYTLYLQAIERASRFTEEDSKAAEQELREALKLDPNFAPAWAALANVYNTQNTFGSMFGQTAEVRRMTKDAAERAIQLDPKLAVAHVALSLVAYANFDIAAYQHELQAALEIEPGNVAALEVGAYASLALGRLDEAADRARQTMARDPLDVDAYRALALALWFGGHGNEAQAELRRVLAFRPDVESFHYRLAQIMVHDGHPELALHELDAERSPQWQRIGRAMAYDALGRRAEADSLIASLIAGEGGWAYQLAEIFANRGDRDRAFEWLEYAYRARDIGLFGYVRSDPMLGGLRTDPRYAALMARVFPGL
jgi:TolB-like protein